MLICRYSKVDRMERQRQDAVGGSGRDRLFESGIKVKRECRFDFRAVQDLPPGFPRRVGLERHSFVSFEVEHPERTQVLYSESRDVEGVIVKQTMHTYVTNQHM